MFGTQKGEKEIKEWGGTWEIKKPEGKAWYFSWERKASRKTHHGEICNKTRKEEKGVRVVIILIVNLEEKIFNAWLNPSICINKYFDCCNEY